MSKWSNQVFKMHSGFVKFEHVVVAWIGKTILKGMKQLAKDLWKCKHKYVGLLLDIYGGMAGTTNMYKESKSAFLKHWTHQANYESC